ncbi:MAG: hypothetical protein WC477_06235 [Patescibacteria group bacterium]
MNENTARENGYTFTGDYSRDKEDMKAIAAQIRASGKRAIIVTIHNRGRKNCASTGYAVYEKIKE